MSFILFSLLSIILSRPLSQSHHYKHFGQGPPVAWVTVGQIALKLGFSFIRPALLLQGRTVCDKQHVFLFHIIGTIGSGQFVVFFISHTHTHTHTHSVSHKYTYTHSLTHSQKNKHLHRDSVVITLCICLCVTITILEKMDESFPLYQCLLWTSVIITSPSRDYCTATSAL